MANGESIIKVYDKPKLNNPLLLVGLPGIGLVSKLAADHLVKTTGAKKLATLYSKHFPNQVIAMKSGRMRLFSMRFYYKKMGKRDVIIVKGDLQPLTVEGQYDVSFDTIDYFKQLGGREVIAMAGYAVAKKIEKPVIYCTATDKAFFKKLLASGAKKTEGTVPIVGLAGLIPATAELKGVSGACLLAETPGNMIDARGAAALLEVIGKFTGAKIDSKNLEERAKKAQEALRKMEQRAGVEQTEAPAVPGVTPEVIKKDVTYIR